MSCYALRSLLEIEFKNDYAKMNQFLRVLFLKLENLDEVIKNKN